MKGRKLFFRSVFTFTFSILGFSGIGTAQTANFQGLGDLPDGDFESDAYAVSADGLTVVGRGCTTPLGAHYVDYEAFRCTPGLDMEGLGHIPPGPGGPYPYQQYSEATSASYDGSTIVGWCNVPISMPAQSGGWTGFRWDETNQMQPLDWFTTMDDFSAPTEGRGLLTISDDGNTIVGKMAHSSSSWEGFCWKQTNPQTHEGVLIGLGDFMNSPFGMHGAANDVSSDGAIVVGSAAYRAFGMEPSAIYYDEAFRWSDTNGNNQAEPEELHGLGFLVPPQGIFSPSSEARAVSAYGSVVVGWSVNDAGYLRDEAFRWTLTNPDTGEGVMEGLGVLESEWIGFSYALDVSADGSIIVGTTGMTAFIWDESNGMRELKIVLETDYGLDLTGWTLISANGISADGLTIVGSGINPDGNPEAWIVTIPEPSCLVLFSLAGLCVVRRRKTLRDSENSQ
jgi:uncharacterized membrane protein